MIRNFFGTVYEAGALEFFLSISWMGYIINLVIKGGGLTE